MPFSSLNLSLLSGNKDKQDKGGKTDLLLRFFDSQFFDEWICITYAVPCGSDRSVSRNNVSPRASRGTATRVMHRDQCYISIPTRSNATLGATSLDRYLYKSNQQGIQDYLCNRLYDLPEQGVERYLSQLTQLLVQRQNPLLDKVVVDLCARSLRIAVKVCCVSHLCHYTHSAPRVHRRTGCCWRFHRTSRRTSMSPTYATDVNRQHSRAIGYGHSSTHQCITCRSSSSSVLFACTLHLFPLHVNLDGASCCLSCVHPTASHCALSSLLSPTHIGAPLPGHKAGTTRP